MDLETRTGECCWFTGRPEQMNTLGLLTSAILERFFCDVGVARKISSDSESLSGTLVLLGVTEPTSSLTVDVFGAIQSCIQSSFWLSFYLNSLLKGDHFNLHFVGGRGRSAVFYCWIPRHRHPSQLLDCVWLGPTFSLSSRRKDSSTGGNPSSLKAMTRWSTSAARPLLSVFRRSWNSFSFDQSTLKMIFTLDRLYF